MFTEQKTGRFQFISTIILMALLAFLVIFFLSKANAQELEIRAVGKQNLTQKADDGYIDRYSYVNPGEDVKFQVVYRYLNANGKEITVYSNPDDLTWEIDGNQTNLRSSQHYSHYMVPFSYGWDAITIVARSYRYQNLEAYFFLYNSQYNDQAYSDGDDQYGYTDYDYYEDIPDDFDSQVIIEKHFIPVYVDGYRFYRFRSPLVGYTPYTCGQFVMTRWGLRYIPCRDYPWEWIWAYRGCPIYHNTYGWLWYWDSGISIAGIHLGINFYYANNWIYYHPYNPYYQHIYDMGYRNGWYDRDRFHRHVVVVPRDGFLHRRVRDMMIRNVDAGRIRASMITRNQIKDLRHKEFERITGKKVELVRGPKDEKVFKGDFKGRLRETFEASRMKRGSVVARGDKTTNDRTPTRVDRTPTRVERTPTKVDRTPTNVERTPTRVNRTPTRVERTPTKVDRTPTKVERTPTRVNQTPTRVERTPTKVDRTPTKVERTPTRVDRAPTRVERTPTKVDRTPTKVERTPTRVNRTPTRVERTPTKVDRTPTKVERTPTRVDRTPTRVERTPTKVDRTPTKVERQSSPQRQERSTPSRSSSGGERSGNKKRR